MFNKKKKQESELDELEIVRVDKDGEVGPPQNIKLKPEKNNLKSGDSSETPRDQEIIVQNIEHHKKALFMSMRISGFLLILFLFSIGGNYYQYLNVPKPTYFATNTDMQLVEIVPLNKPKMSQGGLLNWIADTVADTFTFDFRGYEQQLDANRDHYTPNAYRDLIRSLKVGSLAMVIEKRYIARCVVDSTPIITKEGTVNGTYAWIVKVPITITYESSKGIVNKQKLQAKMIVERCDTSSNPRGIRITQLVTSHH